MREREREREVWMMTIVALAYLASCLTVGLVVVVPPESLDPQQQQQPPASSYETPHLLHSAKQAVKHAAQHVLCDQPPCPPTALDNLKDSLHHGYHKTAESFEGSKDYVSEGFQVSKESAEDGFSHAKVSLHDTPERAKHGMHETVEKAKHGVHDTVEKAKNGVHDAVEKVKHGLHTTKEKAASLIDGKAPEPEDPASYIMPGVSKTMETLKKTFDEERHEILTVIKDSPAMDALKIKAHSTYIQSGRHMEDGIEGVKKGVKETVREVQDKASHLLECASGMAHCARDKAGNLIGGIKERLTPRRTHIKADGDGLETEVRELCSLYADDQGKQESAAHVLDVSAVRESYGYLMESANRAVDGAKEIFEKAIEGEGAEWKEKYMYLADSAKGALESAKDVFGRAITAMENDMQKEAGDHVKASLRKKHLPSRLKESAVRSKERISVTIRSLTCILYLASFSTALGVTLWTTFCSGYILSRVLPRQQFAIVHSKLFPVYLRLITGCLLICAIGHTVLQSWRSADWLEHLQCWNLSLSLVVSLCNMLLLEPKATKVMFEKLRAEREEGRGQSVDSTDQGMLAPLTSLDTKLKVLHQIASFANLVIIGGLTWHLWHLAHRLVI